MTTTRPRCEALCRALEIAEAEASRTGSVIARIEVDAIRLELDAERARVPGAALHRTWRWPK